MIWRCANVITAASTLTRVSALLEVPVIVSEQNPGRLGSTVDEVKSHIPAHSFVQSKMKFSMVSQEVEQRLTHTHIAEHVILCGIEAHVCVQQTALDLLRMGFQVHIVVDAVSSQRQGDRAVALANLSAAGAALTTTEAVVFQLLEDASHPKFKEVQKIIIEHNEATHGLQPGLDTLA